MATAAKTVEPVTDIVAQVEHEPALVLIDTGARDRLFEHIEDKIARFEPDTSTAKGRSDIKSFAFDITRTKTAADKARLQLTAEAREKINSLNAAGKLVIERLADLATQVRAPLTAWEDAEKERIEQCNEVIDWLSRAGVVNILDTAADVRARIAEVEGAEFDEATYQDLHGKAEALRKIALAALSSAIDRLDREEAERAELERLGAAETERQAREAAEREERERAERERIAAEEAEHRQQEAEEAEKRRIAEAEERAAQAARDEEVRKAREAEQEREREHQAALAEERRQREDAERIAREEQVRRQAEEMVRQREAEAERKREENRAHRSRVQKAAKEAIMACGTNEATAKKIVLAIVGGEIPNVSLRF